MKRIVFLMSDTGNGHRAAAEAISAALKIRYGDAVQCEIVDVFKHYTPFPFRNFPEYYPKMMVHTSNLYGLSYKLSNTPRRARFLTSVLHAYSYPLIRNLPTDYDADAVVSTHSIITGPSLSAFRRLDKRPLFFTVIVDLVSAHMFWYDTRSDMLLLPTEIAYQNGVNAGVHPNRMVVTGIPVHPDFARSTFDQQTARHELGWEKDLPVILLVGGGDGIGRLYDIADKINDSSIPCQLAIITGRNAKLRQSLESILWKRPVNIYGFTSEMYKMMSASNILITKAGSLTISEAFVAGLPMLLYEALPGQEEGNLRFVVDTETGLYAPSSKTMVRRLRELLVDDDSRLKRYASNAKKLGRPDAVWKIAESIWQQL